MIAKIIYKSGDKVIIEWSDKSESGQISIVYDEKGRYIVNAEYIGIDRLLEILSKTTSSDIEEMVPSLLCPKCNSSLKYSSGHATDPQLYDDPNYWCECGFKLKLLIWNHLTH